MAGRLGGAAGRDNALGADEVRLVILARGRPAGGEARLNRLRLLRDDRGRPIFVGEPEPAAVALDISNLAGLFLDASVGDFLHRAVADHADEALVQHGVAGYVGLASA